MCIRHSDIIQHALTLLFFKNMCGFEYYWINDKFSFCIFLKKEALLLMSPNLRWIKVGSHDFMKSWLEGMISRWYHVAFRWLHGNRDGTCGKWNRGLNPRFHGGTTISKKSLEWRYFWNKLLKKFYFKKNLMIFTHGILFYSHFTISLALKILSWLIWWRVMVFLSFISHLFTYYDHKD